MRTRFLAFAMLQMVTLARNEILTAEQRYMALCLRTIIHRNFMPGLSLFVSLPNKECYGTMQKCDCLQLVNFILEEIHQEALWPLHVVRTDFTTLEMTEEQLRIHHNYIIFTWPEEVQGDVIETLVTQLDYLQSASSWNPRSRFFVVVTVNDTRPSHLLALKICETLWMINRIINVVIVIANDDQLLHAETHIFDLYTWFPYGGSVCAKPTQVVLMTQCLSDNNGQPSNNVPLFPNKVPKNLQGCPVRVSATELIPYVILTTKYTDSDGNTFYNYGGLEMQYLLLLAEATNLTVVFLPPAEGDVKDTHFQQLLDVSNGTSDVTVGHFPLNLILTAYADPTLTIVFDTLRWYVPCPKPAARIEKVTGVYTWPVWCNIALVFVLIAVVFWRSANIAYSAVAVESQNYRHLSRCVYILWAVSLGVSVSEMPRGSTLRAIFSVFLFYSFVMGIVFQGHFISFLVSPGYHNPISNFDDLLNSGLPYGKDENLDFFMRLAKYYEQERFESYVDCSARHKCLERLFTVGDVAMLSPVIDVMYVISHVGLAQNRKVICMLDDNVFPLDISLYLTKGHPLLDLFNLVIRRCTETGLVAKYWSDLLFNNLLQNVGNSNSPSCEVCSGMYFVFSLSHLKVAFVVLVFGFVLGAIAFLAELVFHSKSYILATIRYE
jgi:hypothetical protein